MAISVNPQTFVITIPQADLTWVSGTIYELDTNAFRLQLKAWEDDQDGGITFLVTHVHNTAVTVAGTTFARTVEILPPYSVEFEDGQYTVILRGSNNNIFDVENGILVQNQVQIISTNSAGLIEVKTGSGVTPGDVQDIADAVWDEPLTGANHNVPTSAGRRLRDTSSSVIHTGEAVSATTNTITLNGDASAVDGAYDPALISIINGTGFGQTRLVLGYNGTTKTAVVDRNWKINPDATSEYAIVSHPGREHINEGLAQAGTINTITLNALASDQDNTYVGQVIFLRSGTGEDQACRITAYDGTTKVASLAKDWHTTPDATTAYVMLPSSILDLAKYSDTIADKVWDEDITTHTDPNSAGKEVQDTKRDVGDAQGLILSI